ncbi:chemotaxis response regulator protein-glutamate methylesterase [Tychonema sp. BBK16]|uniref:chemotaxis response regulator protein-glutamate methylesterase n=1 Tax=Tychonema sp. BBK16 TaxID=2699888 RepID=UPI001F3576B1|nr:chemotaxis response regulator protein-glutamate methylesterase [Tychonema sp. BBK16]MCF6373288.1 chemotaxis response regulator protein-glutamate methylesterase [Tychonema sp. BBK16]
MKIAIVNDTLIAVEALRRVVITVPEYDVIWIARDGAEAVEKSAKNTPDLILMDLVMPVMDGVEATRQIMRNSPCAILVVTSSTTTNVGRVFEAMGYGALDAINTPILGVVGGSEGGAVLLQSIAKIARLLGKSVIPAKSSPSSIKPLVRPLVAIGSSTGGPQALATVLASFPVNFSAPIVIVQHIDAEFAPGLADWLNQQTPLSVELAIANHPLQAGKAFIAGTNDHLILQSNLTFGYTNEPLDNPYRPSVDRFFESIIKYWPGKGVGVLLTGMGKDGAKGLKALRDQGWYTIAQDRASSVVYGMPKAAAELDAAVEVLPVSAIGSACLRYL